MMETVLLATKNKGKKKELERLLSHLNIEVKTLLDFPDFPDIVENGKSFAENACLKAKTACELTGYIAIGDDSGLEVFALDGMPGIYSARFSGEDHNDKANNQLLLEKLSSYKKQERKAQFKTVMALACPGEENCRFTVGILQGEIIEEEKGDNGFGYDPLFVPENSSHTLAEYALEEKNAISHRGRALAKMIPFLELAIGDQI